MHTYWPGQSPGVALILEILISPRTIAVSGSDYSPGLGSPQCH